MIDGSRSSRVTLLNLSEKSLRLRVGHFCGTGVEMEEFLDEDTVRTAEESFSGTFSLFSVGCISCIQGPMGPGVCSDLESVPLGGENPWLEWSFNFS